MATMAAVMTAAAVTVMATPSAAVAVMATPMAAAAAAAVVALIAAAVAIAIVINIALAALALALFVARQPRHHHHHPRVAFAVAIAVLKGLKAHISGVIPQPPDRTQRCQKRAIERTPPLVEGTSPNVDPVVNHALSPSPSPCRPRPLRHMLPSLVDCCHPRCHHCCRRSHRSLHRTPPSSLTPSPYSPPSPSSSPATLIPIAIALPPSPSSSHALIAS